MRNVYAVYLTDSPNGHRFATFDTVGEAYKYVHDLNSAYSWHGDFYIYVLIGTMQPKNDGRMN